MVINKIITQHKKRHNKI